VLAVLLSAGLLSSCVSDRPSLGEASPGSAPIEVATGDDGSVTTVAPPPADVDPSGEGAEPATPDETDAPAQTGAPDETEAPDESEAPAETDGPEETDPPNQGNGSDAPDAGTEANGGNGTDAPGNGAGADEGGDGDGPDEAAGPDDGNQAGDSGEAAPPVQPGNTGGLGPENLLGFIATPTGNPVVRTEPDLASGAIDIPATTSAGAPTTFAIIGEPTDGPDGWHEIVLPTRPNGARAWVPADSVGIARTPKRVFIDLGARSLRVEDGGREVFRTEVAIGESANPTPVGATYITELIESINPGGTYGPYAFGLALHSDTLTEFAGGPGQVGFHGTNQPQLIGDRVSNGCIRLTNDDIRRVVDLQLPLGAPVFIT
jgi:lipoprotein-anchoring transpeptidase ErfK/SrfK